MLKHLEDISNYVTMEHYPIAIIGGGLSGLTAARVLQVNGIKSAVFELETDRNARMQGGMLDIHAETGQRALRAARLYGEFLQNIHPGGEAMRILDRHGTVLRDERDHGQLERPEIKRGTLRDLLLDSLDDGTVRWGSKIAAVKYARHNAAAKYEVELADGNAFTADLLIGADGAWSKVRPLVSQAFPSYSGISFVEVDLFNADARHPAEAAAMGAGMLFALGGETGILGHRESDGSLHVYLGHRANEDWLDTIDFSGIQTSKRAILELLDGWNDALRGMISNADTPLVPRRIHALPIGHSWPRVPGVTLMGDAAHLMSPFAGEGANLAMFDASELALSIAGQPDNVEAALAAYETGMFARSAASARDSAASLETIFALDAPKGLLAMFAGFDGSDAVEATKPLDPDSSSAS